MEEYTFVLSTEGTGCVLAAFKAFNERHLDGLSVWEADDEVRKAAVIGLVTGWGGGLGLGRWLRVWGGRGLLVRRQAADGGSPPPLATYVG